MIEKQIKLTKRAREIQRRQYCEQGCTCKKCHDGSHWNERLCDFCVFEKWRKKKKTITPQQGDWEKDLDKRFNMIFPTEFDRKLKSFISQLLQQEREELVGKIEEMKADKVEGKDETINDVAFNTWNGAINKVLSLIKKQ